MNSLVHQQITSSTGRLHDRAEPSPNGITDQSRCHATRPGSARRTTKLAAALLIAFTSIGAQAGTVESTTACRHGVDIPLDRPIVGFAALNEPAVYRLEVSATGLLAIEAISELEGSLSFEIGAKKGSSIRWRDLTLDFAAGRRIVEVVEVGTLCVTVASPGPNRGLFELLAWLTPGPYARASAKDGTSDGDGADDPPQEPVDEWIESRVEPDLMPIPDEVAPRWYDLPGFGVGRLVIDPTRPAAPRFDVWSLCPEERADLGVTRTCARSRR